MILKLTGAASALLTLVLITSVGVGADEKKEEKKAGTKPDFAGIISAVSEDMKTVTITKKKKGEEGVKKEFKLDGAEVEVGTEDKKIKEGMFGMVWYKDGDETKGVAKFKAGERKMKKKTE